MMAQTTESPRRILAEVTMPSREAPHAPAPFPQTCPNCGAAKTSEVNGADVIEYKRTISYACGAAYTYKSQIQNHTEKWWGACPAPAPERDA